MYNTHMAELLVQKCVDKLSIKRDNPISKLWNKTKDATHKTKLENLCQILYGDSLPQQNTGEKLFNDLIHLWFNNNSVIEELHQLFKLSGLCFLHEIHFTFSATDNDIYATWVSKHGGKSNTKNRMFDPSKYIKTQIEKCKDRFMAIPISFDFKGNAVSHANILFIKMGEHKKGERITVELERFDPHGSAYNKDSIKSQRVNAAMRDLGISLFSDESKYDLKPLIEPIDHCPSINVRGLQLLTANSAFEGSCTIFSILYAILKLINPERSQSEIADDIYKILKKHNNPSAIIRLICNVLTGMLNITKEGEHYYVVNDAGKKRAFLTQTEDLINNWIKNTGTNVVIHRGKKYEGKFENGLFAEGTITFEETNPRKIYTGKVNGETMQMHDPNGELVMKNGIILKGNFVDGALTGKGTLNFDGSIYEGDFLNSLKHGKGIFRYKNGDSYNGDWLNDKRHGKGTYFHKDAEYYYKGEWKDDQKHGEGLHYFKNEDIVRGRWKDGIMEHTGKNKTEKSSSSKSAKSSKSSKSMKSSSKSAKSSSSKSRSKSSKSRK